jgi:hypothetical protein
MNQLPLEGRDEALGHRVVVGVYNRAHRGQKTFLLEPASELNRRVLAASVGVMDEPWLGPASVVRLAFKASTTSSVLRLLAMGQPTIFLE